MSIFTKDTAVAELTQDKLAQVPRNVLNVSTLSADAIWRAIQAAEQEAAGKLGVPLEPIRIFSIIGPTAEELTALDDKPYLVEPGYDLDEGFFSMGQWGTLALRKRPIVSVESVRLVYPGINAQIYEVPHDWILPDHKAGLLQFMPAPGATGMPAAILAFNAVNMTRYVPQLIRVKYTAGLTDNHPAFLDVRDTILRLAVVRLVKSGMHAQSASISADGLSQSQSFDIRGHQEQIDFDLANLRQRILGIVFGVV